MQPLDSWNRGFEFRRGRGFPLVFVLCCVGNGLRNWLISGSEESYGVCAFVADTETSKKGHPWPDFGLSATGKVLTLTEAQINRALCFCFNGCDIIVPTISSLKGT
jgi:hypothetical protein